MPLRLGKIALMGSGELTTTMVEVHKELLNDSVSDGSAVFLDTPAGFQLNVDQLSRKAVEYFNRHVQHPLTVASFKSRTINTPLEAEKAFHTLRKADFILMGPGSPTYTVQQLQATPIPKILIERIEQGGCLVAASAAALTVGSFTLPVYEIYKVGEELHWIDGMNILGHFGFNIVVIPHWNNAEGGTHDTRFCYMGQSRFEALESLLPPGNGILGLDEHTACILDFQKHEGLVRGIGQVTLRRQGTQTGFRKGDRFPLRLLRDHELESTWQPTDQQTQAFISDNQPPKPDFWDRIHAVQARFDKGLKHRKSEKITNALLELDRIIWQAHEDIESQEFVSQARDMFREMIVSLGTDCQFSSPPSDRQVLAPLVEQLLDLRDHLRRRKQWQHADAIRDCLQRAGIIVEDTPKGARWRIRS